jgi:hypothetical protein
MTIPYIIGQIIGIISMAIFFVSYQCKEAKKLMLLQCVAVAAMCTHYLLIGATSGLVLNTVCLVRNICYANRDKKFLSGNWVPIFFCTTMGIVGIISWQDYYSIFILVALIINTAFLSQPNTQYLRYSILLTSPLVFIYDVFVLSWGGMANETLAITSSVIGIIRLKQENKKSLSSHNVK